MRGQRWSTQGEGRTSRGVNGSMTVLWGGRFPFPRASRSLDMNSQECGWQNGGSKACVMCGRGVDETVEHLMLAWDETDCATTKMPEIVMEEAGVGEWSGVRERGVAVGRWSMGKKKSDKRVIERERFLKVCLASDKQRQRDPL